MAFIELFIISRKSKYCREFAFLYMDLASSSDTLLRKNGVPGGRSNA